VANLFLVRATGRARELAIRSALGSSGLRIARQLLVESLLLAGMGGLAGLGVAVAGQRALLALGGDAIPRLDEVGLDPVVLGVAALLTVATGLAFGMAPAARSARIHPRQALQAQSRSSTGGRGQGRLRDLLAATQVALALTLLAGAGALMTSFYRIQQVDLGFRTERTLTFDLSLPSARYDVQRRIAFQEELAQRLEAIPGVTKAGGTSRLPGTGRYHVWGTGIKTGPRAGDWLSGQAQHRTISGDLFEALGLPLLAGRRFDARDSTEAPPHAIVSADFARLSFPGLAFEDVVGQRLVTIPSRLEREIVGVVGDVALDPYGSPAPTVYHAHRQFAVNRNWLLTQVVATELPAASILPAVQAAVAALDPELVVYRPAPLDDVVGRGVGRERFALALMAAFAAVALALAAIGLYGVLAYSVRQRTQEIGIRMALGATRAAVRGLVLRQAALVVGAGVTAGLCGALALGGGLSALVFQTSPRDPRILIGTVLVLAAVALGSAWLPAWRASRVEPRIAMQED
jgi:predicted permease